MLEKIIGQPHALDQLESDFKSGRIADSYIFSGPNGVGKRSAALEFAKAVNCANVPEDSFISELSPGAIPCGACSSCKKIESNSHPDVFVLDFESQAQLLQLREEQELKQKELRIEAVRTLINRSRISPLEARKKFFVIDHAELLSTESSNALLKVLEESSKQCHWFLIALSLERVAQTVRSRCRKVSFSPLAPGAIRDILRQKLRDREDAEEKIERAMEFADDSFEAVVSFLEADTSDLVGYVEQALGIGSVKTLHPLELSSQVLADKRKVGNRKRAQQFMKLLGLRAARELRRNPKERNLKNLFSILHSQETLNRNVSPQTVLDSLILSLQTP